MADRAAAAIGGVVAVKLREAMAQCQCAVVVQALIDAEGSVYLAARALGIHKKTLYALMDKHGIVRSARVGRKGQ